MSKMCLDTTECTEAIVKLGIKKVSYPALKVLILGFMGGMFIGLSAIGNLIANQTIGGGLGKIVGSCVFPVGLILVVLVGGSLFTGDCLAYLAWFEGKVDFNKMMKNLGLVWIGNLLGSVFTAFVAYAGGQFASTGLANFAVHVAEHKVHLEFGEALASAFLCNVLVALAVWFSFAAKDMIGKIFAIWFPIMLFILGGYQHVVANMTYISVGKILSPDSYTLVEMIRHFIPVTIGNFLSGAIFLPLVYKTLYLKKHHHVEETTTEMENA